jgi:hypothetical protein
MIAVGAVTVASVSIIAVTLKHFLGSTAVETTSTAKQELITGSIESRWPKPGVGRQTAVAEASPEVAAPKVAALEAAPAPEPEKRMVVAKPTCNNPSALGVSRTAQIDTTGGPGFGMSQYRDYDFLQPGEVVLTFDDGPTGASSEAPVIRTGTGSRFRRRSASARTTRC